MSFRERIAGWWAPLAPERKRVILAGGLIGMVLLVSAVANKQRSVAPAVAPQAKPKLDMSVVTAPRKDEGVQDLRTTVATLTNQLKASSQNIDALNRHVALLKESNQQQQTAQMSELARDLAAIKQEVRAYQSDTLAGPSPNKVLELPPLPPPEAKVEVKAAAAPKKPRLRIADQGGGAQAEPAPGKELAAAAGSVAKSSDAGAKLAAGNADVGDGLMQFIPAGTIINGVLLSGIDAPTSGMAQKQPVPALMKVQTLAFLPNRVTQDLRACHIILSGYGVLSSERAKLRTEVLTCIRNDGGVIEAPLDGFAVGADGKEGIRGLLVTKQGSQIARSLFAGFISGFANVMKPTVIPSLNTSTSSTQSWQLPDVNSAMTAGALTGVGGAANDVARFFLDTAKEMHPVVEVPSETKLSVVLLRGGTLALGQKPKAGAAAKQYPRTSL